VGYPDTIVEIAESQKEETMVQWVVELTDTNPRLRRIQRLDEFQTL
jgi:hypothetical protein